MEELQSISIPTTMGTGSEISMYLTIEYLNKYEQKKLILPSENVSTQIKKPITVKIVVSPAVMRESSQIDRNT